MAVLSMMRFEGDPDELIAAFREHMMPVGQRLREKHGGLGMIVARTDNGILAVNLWETEEGRHAMAEEPEIKEAIAAAGFPQPHFEGYEVLEMRITEQAVTAAAPA
jgi:hypothetical protein